LFHGRRRSRLGSCESGWLFDRRRRFGRRMMDCGRRCSQRTFDGLSVIVVCYYMDKSVFTVVMIWSKWSPAACDASHNITPPKLL
jgi:uncharacterized protein (DUF983 family)